MATSIDVNTDKSNEASEFVTPGQRLCELDDDISYGKGVYERDGWLYASLVGYLQIEQDSSSQKKEIYVKTDRNRNSVPTVGGLVTCRITQATSRFCKADIIGVDGTILETPFRGLLRKEDIRPTEKDKVEIHKSFRPSDIVLCRVISIGDAQSYILTTAENELGVIIAVSDAGGTMVPISWNEMKCPKTNLIENRKVAKPSNEHITKLRAQLS